MKFSAGDLKEKLPTKREIREKRVSDMHTLF